MRIAAGLIFASAVSLVVAGPAWSQTAADLGKTLTPLGAIKAGNADKTIPAYEGGIATPPAGYRATS